MKSYLTNNVILLSLILLPQSPFCTEYSRFSARPSNLPFQMQYASGLAKTRWRSLIHTHLSQNFYCTTIMNHISFFCLYLCRESHLSAFIPSTSPFPGSSVPCWHLYQPRQILF